jgi:hypothetical protein
LIPVSEQHTLLTEYPAVKAGQTNSGKKEQRQINQVLTKSVTEDGTRGKETEARASTKQHKLKSSGRKLNS